MTQLWEIIDDKLDGITWHKLRTGPGEGRPPGFGSAPPINVHNYALLSSDSRARPSPDNPDDVGPLPVRVLWDWEHTAAAAGGDYRNFNWVKHQPWVTDYVADLRTMAAQLSPRPRPMGYCRRILGWGTNDLVVCREPLYMPEQELAETAVHSSESAGEPEAAAEPAVEEEGRDLEQEPADTQDGTDTAEPEQQPEDEHPDAAGDTEVDVWDCPTIRCPRCGEEYTGTDLLRLKVIADADRRHSRSDLLNAREGAPQRMASGPDPVYDGPLFVLDEDERQLARDGRRSA